MPTRSSPTTTPPPSPEAERPGATGSRSPRPPAPGAYLPGYRVHQRGVALQLRQSRWVRAVAGTLLFTAVCALMADWQWHRRAEAIAAIHLVTGNDRRRSVAVPALLPSPAVALPASEEWRSVRARGRYLREETLLVRNRDDGNGDSGYLVLVPLRLASGAVLVVDRGWLPPSGADDGPPPVPAPPRGEVTVVARLRPSEAPDPRTAPAGQVQDIDLAGSVRRGIARSASPTAAADAAALLRGGYGMLVSESPSPATAPTLQAPPDLSEGPHLSYTVQWCVFAVGAWIFLVVHLRRTAYEEDVAAGRRTPRAVVAVVDPRRRRSDEEVEDAQVVAAGAHHDAELEARRHVALRAAAQAELISRER